MKFLNKSSYKMIAGFILIVILALIFSSYFESNKETINNYELSDSFDKENILS